STASPTHTPAPTPSFFFFMPRPPPTSTLFPYTTLFRSAPQDGAGQDDRPRRDLHRLVDRDGAAVDLHAVCDVPQQHRLAGGLGPDRKSTRLNSSHVSISYAVFCLKKKKHTPNQSAEHVT